MVLPAQFANEVRHGEKILFCPYCSRILFYEESLDADQPYYSLEDTSLSDDEDLLTDDEDLIDSMDDEETKSSDYE